MIDEAERREAIRNKRDIESRAIDVLEGRIKITERGPLEFRPEVPQDLKGYLLSDARDTRRYTSETPEQAEARRRKADEYNAHLRRLYGLD